MLTIDWHPDRHKLRQFAWISLAGFGLFGIIALLRFGSLPAAIAFWAVALAMPVLGLTAPAAVRPVYLLLTLIALPIGFVVSHVILGAAFYLVFGSVGMVLRWIGRDSLHRRIDRSLPTYWTERGEPRPPASYYRQF